MAERLIGVQRAAAFSPSATSPERRTRRGAPRASIPLRRCAWS